MHLIVPLAVARERAPVEPHAQAQDLASSSADCSSLEDCLLRCLATHHRKLQNDMLNIIAKHKSHMSHTCGEPSVSQMPPAGEPQENRIVTTEMEEFVLGLQFNEEIRRPDAEDVSKDDEDDIPTSVQHDV